jgi:hypothetical protein
MRLRNYKKSEAELAMKEEGFEPGRWWQAVDSEGKLLAETSNPDEFKGLGLLDEEGVTFRRLYARTENVWVDESPIREEIPFPEEEN